MNKKLYALYAVAFSLAMLACSNDNVTGSSEDPNVVTAEKNSSSSGFDVDISSSATVPLELSSSSTENRATSSETVSSSSMKKFSSSSATPILCKVGGDWGDVGCVNGQVFGDGDLFSIGDFIVKTNVYVSDSSKFGKRAGEIFFETDSIEGGKTRLFWNADSSSEFNGSLYAHYWLDHGNSTKEPFINVGFYDAGFDSNGNMLSADISGWNGICMMYRGSIDPIIQLDLGDSLNKKLGYALPSVMVIPTREESGFYMTRSRTNEILCYEWNQFKQPDVDGDHEVISGDDAAKHVARVIFHFQSQSNDEKNYFSFLAIGTNRD